MEQEQDRPGERQQKDVFFFCHSPGLLFLAEVNRDAEMIYCEEIR